MSGAANPVRGEAALFDKILRPTFAALAAAEEELGSLLALVERAAEGNLKLSEMAALFWHCLEEDHGLTRDELEAAVVKAGLAAVTPALKSLLHQILKGL